MAERHSFSFSFITTPPPLSPAPNLFKMSPKPPSSPPPSPSPLFASSWQSQASWNIPLQIVSLRQCCLSFFHHRRGSGHTHLSLWTSCPAPSVHCPLCTHSRKRTHTHTLALKCGSYWQRRHAREQFMFIGLCQNKYNIRQWWETTKSERRKRGEERRREQTRPNKSRDPFPHGQQWVWEVMHSLDYLYAFFVGCWGFLCSDRNTICV